jgi:hypothetical protein
MQITDVPPNPFEAMRVVIEAEIDEEGADFQTSSEFIRITDEH